LVGTAGLAQKAPPTAGGLGLSPDTRTLLQAEMREIAGASQALVPAIVSGNWESIEHFSEQISASYVMEKELSAAQREELAAMLPEHFKALDGEFHSRAERLGSAAAAMDAELVVFQYARLLETCTACHANYARDRFPGFSVPRREVHEH
jgi:hypothetical protein